VHLGRGEDRASVDHHESVVGVKGRAVAKGRQKNHAVSDLFYVTDGAQGIGIVSGSSPRQRRSARSTMSIEDYLSVSGAFVSEASAAWWSRTPCLPLSPFELALRGA